jgi:3-oxoacyl-[acyl-carrier-protein] synthase-1
VVLVVPELADRWPTAEPYEPSELSEHYLKPLLSSCGLQVADDQLSVLVGTKITTIESLRDASRRLADHGTDHVLVVASDSYLEPGSIGWLNRQRRLKTPSAPAGLLPGEAACAVLLSRTSSTARDSLRIESVHVNQEGHEPFDERPETADRFAAAVRAAIGDSPFHGDWIHDLNGELWKAQQYGCLRLRVGSQLSEENVSVHFPVGSTGEIGCTQPLLGLCVAQQAFHRAYARSDRALITCTTEFGDVGAVQVRSQQAN